MEEIKKQTIKDRLLIYIDNLKIGQAKFEKVCGLSNGYGIIYFNLA